MNSDSTQTVRTMCPMNCHPTLCGMEVDISGGKLVSVRGDKDNPDSKGFLCVRGQASKEIMGNPKRLLQPMIRDREKRGVDAWREASWDEALDIIAGKMREVGPEAVGIWPGHGNITNDYGFGAKWQLIERFSNMFGCQRWLPTMICWGLGGFGLGITGVLETHTKEDMAENSEMIILWGANLTSQPTTSRHLLAAKKRGAHIVTIDVRETEATAQSHEAYIIKPGADAALALSMMNVIIEEKLFDQSFIDEHTVGFEALVRHVQDFGPAWGEGITGLDSSRIRDLARKYAETKPACILVGGSSMHKGPDGWNGARAVACLPALTGNLGVPGGGIGTRHGSINHGRVMGSINGDVPRKPGTYVPAQMAEIVASLADGRTKVLLLLGTNMISSFADTNRVEAALNQTELIICHDLFMSETARRCADVVLPGTSWLEEIGCKITHTYVYLMDKFLEPEGECRSSPEILKGLAERLGLDGYFPWASQEDVIDAILDAPCTGNATVASMRNNNYRAALDISHVAYPTHQYHTPSGKIEFYSTRAEEAGLNPLPVYEPVHADETANNSHPLTLCQGRTLTHFHSFYDQGRALPTLAKKDPFPKLWLSIGDAEARHLKNGDKIRIYNARGEFEAAAHISGQIPDGSIWIRDGWVGLNNLTSGEPAVPESALGFFHFAAGQSQYEARVEVTGI